MNYYEVETMTEDELLLADGERREAALKLFKEAQRLQQTLVQLPLSERQSVIDKINALDKEAINLMNNEADSL